MYSVITTKLLQIYWWHHNYFTKKLFLSCQFSFFSLCSCSGGWPCPGRRPGLCIRAWGWPRTSWSGSGRLVEPPHTPQRPNPGEQYYVVAPLLQLSHLLVLTLLHLKVCLSLSASNSVLIRERREYLLLDRRGYRGGGQGTYQHNLRELSTFNQMAPWQSYQLYSFSKPKRKWSWDWGYLKDH